MGALGVRDLTRQEYAKWWPRLAGNGRGHGEHWRGDAYSRRPLTRANRGGGSTEEELSQGIHKSSAVAEDGGSQRWRRGVGDGGGMCVVESSWIGEGGGV